MVTTATTTAPENGPAKAILISTARGVRLKRLDVEPKQNYNGRSERQVVRKLSTKSLCNKIATLGQLDMTPMRHEDFAYVTLHYPTVDCFIIYAITPEMVAKAWKKMREWIGRNVPNPITGKNSLFWNMEYQKTHYPHYSLGLVIPVSMEKKMIAFWRKVVGHPTSMADDDIIHFSRRDPETASPEATARYMSQPKGHQEESPTEWSSQGWNPPAYWGVVGMERLPQAVTPIIGEENIKGVNARMRELSDTEVIEFQNPKTGEVQKSFKSKWNIDSPKGSGEIRNSGDGLLIHDELIALYGSETDLN